MSMLLQANPNDVAQRFVRIGDLADPGLGD